MLKVRTKKVKRIYPSRYKGWLLLGPGSTFTFNEIIGRVEVRYDDYGWKAIKLGR